MSDLVKFNIARGLSSLADQMAAKLTARAPMLEGAFKFAADMAKQSIQENPAIPKEDMTALEIVRSRGGSQRRHSEQRRSKSLVGLTIPEQERRA